MAGQLHGQSARVVRSISRRISQDAPGICRADGGRTAGGNREDAAGGRSGKGVVEEGKTTPVRDGGAGPMDRGGPRPALGAGPEPSSEGVHDEPGRSRLPAVIDTALSRWRRGAGNGHSEIRSAAPVPPRCRKRKAACRVVARPIRTIQRSSRVPVVWSLVRRRDIEYSDEESGNLEEDDLHPHVRRKRRLLRPRSAVRRARSGESGVWQ